MRELGASVLLVTTACGGTAFVGVSNDAGDLDAGDPDAAAEGGASDSGSAADGGRRMCPALPSTIIDTCSQDTDCAFGTQQVDCCGSVIYVGYSKTFASDFQTAETNLEAACGSCQCPAQALTQDNKVVTDPAKVKVRCLGNQGCRTTGG